VRAAHLDVRAELRHRGHAGASTIPHFFSPALSTLSLLTNSRQKSSFAPFQATWETFPLPRRRGRRHVRHAGGDRRVLFDDVCRRRGRAAADCHHGPPGACSRFRSLANGHACAPSPLASGSRTHCVRVNRCRRPSEGLAARSSGWHWSSRSMSTKPCASRSWGSRRQRSKIWSTTRCVHLPSDRGERTARRMRASEFGLETEHSHLSALACPRACVRACVPLIPLGRARP